MFTKISAVFAAFRRRPADEQPVYEIPRPNHEQGMREAFSRLASQLDAGPISDAQREAIGNLFRRWSNRYVTLREVHDAAERAADAGAP